MNADEERVNWVRGPKRINVSSVPVSKLAEAGDKGLVIEPVDTKKSPNEVIVSKVVVTGMPAPKK